LYGGVCAAFGRVVMVRKATNRSAVEAVLDSLRQERPMSTADEALGQLTLAAVLDEGAGVATAAVSKEHGAVLGALTAREVNDDEPDLFGADLPSTVRNPPPP
jgi:hypothetical protein